MTTMKALRFEKYGPPSVLSIQELPVPDLKPGPVPVVNFIRLAYCRKSRNDCPMGDLLKLIWWGVIGLFRSRASLEAEILILRHQLSVLRRKAPERLAFSNFDRLIFTSLYPIAPRVLGALVIVEPETVYPLASCWISLVLAMEVAMSRAADRRSRLKFAN